MIGAGTDAYISYSQSGGLHIATHTLRGDLRAVPRASAACKMLRNWGGIVDVTPDRSPIIGLTPVPGPLRQLRLGHRRLQGDARAPAMSSRTRSRAASRIRSPRRSRWIASAPAA